MNKKQQRITLHEIGSEPVFYQHPQPGVREILKGACRVLF